MELDRKVIWGLFLLNCIIHFILVPLCILYSIGIINLEVIGVTPYVLDYLGRLTLVSVFLLILLVISIKKGYYKNFHKVFIIFLFTVSLMWDVLGNFLGFYDINGIFGVFWFDDIVHFLTPGFVGIGISWYLYYLKNARKDISILLGGTMSLSLSVIWEFYEYWSDLLLETGMIKDGLADTMADLTEGFLGILLCMGILILVLRRAKSKTNEMCK